MRRAGGQELVGPLAQRPLAKPITAAFVARRVEPLLATLLGLIASLAAAVLFALDVGAVGLVGAGVLALVGSVFDCVDGAAAAAQELDTPARRWLDTMADRISDTAIVLGATIGFADDNGGRLVWIVGFVVAALMILTSYSRKEYELTSGQPYDSGLLDALGRRDVRTFGFFVGGITLHPYAAIVVLGAISAGAFVSGVLRHAVRDLR